MAKGKSKGVNVLKVYNRPEGKQKQGKIVAIETEAKKLKYKWNWRNFLKDKTSKDMAAIITCAAKGKWLVCQSCGYQKIPKMDEAILNETLCPRCQSVILQKWNLSAEQVLKDMIDDGAVYAAIYNIEKYDKDTSYWLCFHNGVIYHSKFQAFSQNKSKLDKTPVWHTTTGWRQVAGRQLFSWSYQEYMRKAGVQVIVRQFGYKN